MRTRKIVAWLVVLAILGTLACLCLAGCKSKTGEEKAEPMPSGDMEHMKKMMGGKGMEPGKAKAGQSGGE